MIKLKANPKKDPIKSRLKSVREFCSEVKRNPSKYPSNVRQGCNSLPKPKAKAKPKKKTTKVKKDK